MDLQSAINQLNKMRFLGVDDSIEVFEDILSEIYYNGDLTVIKELCSIFEDDIDFPSASEMIMKCIIHLCHEWGESDGIHELVFNMNRMFPQGKSCAVKLTKMILREESFTRHFIDALNEVDNDTRNQIIKILTEIKDSDDRYQETVDSVFQRCC